MRAAAWCVAAALALVAVTSALRPTQVEGEARRGRRLQIASAPDAEQESVSQPEVRPSFRPRSSRKFEENVTKEVTRSRTRNRPSQSSEPTAVAPETSPRSPPQAEKNERFDPRRSRTRSKPTEAVETVNISSTVKAQAIRSRSRQFNRRIPTSQATQAPLTSSTSIDESKIGENAANFNDLSKKSDKTDDDALSTFNRRSSTVESEEIGTSKRKRVKLNPRPNARSFNLEPSGDSNKFIEKEPNLIKPAEIDDPRASRKLRYRTRLSETDTNLTGEGLKTLNELKSSQTEENIASQPDIQTTVQVEIDNTLQESTESSQPSSTTTKKNPIVRRPLTRGRINYNPKVKPKPKYSDEIGEEENYPESFKALIQAKNASTQASSPNSENLSVKASRTVKKIYTPSAQTTKTVINKTDTYRNSKNSEDKSDDSKDGTLTTPSDLPKQKKFEYKRRTAYTPRARKTSALESSTTPVSPVSSPSTSRPAYKYNRKFKVSTTEATKRDDGNSENKKELNNSIPRKSLTRSSYYARRRENKNSTENVKSNENILPVNDEPVKRKSPSRPLHYPKLRGKINSVTTSTTAQPESDTTTPGSAERKNEDTGDMPLIFTLLKSPKDVKDESTELQHMSTETKENKEMFIIAVSSKESKEKDLDNEVGSKSDENDSINSNAFPASTKFHASYKEPSTTTEAEEVTNVTPATPAIRNIQTRKYGRQRPRVNNDYNDNGNSDLATSKLREKKLRKFSESQPVRSSESSSSVITSETDKPKSRFSSKYRAAYLDKPNYRPTVPTVTPTNAWLKFFVTDRQLIKSVEEPNWFGEDYYDVTTESMPRPNISSHLFIYEPSLELVEIEEIDVGPDMNAIGITKPRKTLSSADLKLSESLMKPSQVMNVEASNHSPSVTVSIFDVLADLLTSTPKPRISSTTAAPQTTTQNNNDKTHVGVSNNSNVNNIGTKNESFVSTTVDLNTNTKFVQNTEQTTPFVINSLSVGENVTQATISEEVNLTPDEAQPESASTISTPIPTSIPIPITTVAPVTTTTIPTPPTPTSARKPFAIKILYSNTESSTDVSTTSPELKSSHPSTDNPKMVFNTVSDLILSNNNLVSSDLTSMLSNNIRDIMHNMDEKTRSRVSVDMAKLLKALVPRALGGVVSDDVEITQNTTPYSLEDIKDTENVETDTETNQETDVDQNVPTESVNIVENNVLSGFNVNSTQSPVLNNSSTITTMSPLSSLTPLFIVTTNPTSSIDSSTSIPNNDVTFTTTSDNLVTSKNTNNGKTESDSNNNNSLSQNDPQNNNTVSIQSRIGKKLNNNFLTSFNSSPQKLPKNEENSQVSPLQIWVLNKKARVLKMIEDLIQQHNAEIATASTFTDLLNQPNNIPMSQRLTEIINTMTTTNKPDGSLDNNSERQNPIPLLKQISTSTSIPMGISETTLYDTEATSKTVGISLRVGKNLDIDDNVSESPDEGNKIDAVETPATFEDDISNQFNNYNMSTTEIIDTTSVLTSTTLLNAEITTNTESTTEKRNTDFAKESAVFQSSPPKRDYVIFGILPNNTVVRKDPNDDALENLTEKSPYIVYAVLPNNTIIRKFPNGTRVPRVRQKIDILPISPWSLKNPYSPIHNNPAIVKPQFNPTRVSINYNNEPSNDIINNDKERLTNDTVNNLQEMISSPALKIKDSSSLGVTSVAINPPSEKSTASHVLSLRTTTMLPSVDEILLNSISSAAKEEMVISSMTSSTREPTILTLDIDPETQQIRTEKPEDGKAVFKFIPIKEVMVSTQKSNVLKLATKISTINTEKTESPLEIITAATSTVPPSTPTQTQFTDELKSTVPILERTTSPPTFVPDFTTKEQTTTNVDRVIFESSTMSNEDKTNKNFDFNTVPYTTITTEASTSTEGLTTAISKSSVAPTTTTTTPVSTTIAATTTEVPSTFSPTITTTAPFVNTVSVQSSNDIQNDLKKYQEDAKLLETLLQAGERNPKNLNIFSQANLPSTDNEKPAVKLSINPLLPQKNEEKELLKAILSANGQHPNVLTVPNIGGNLNLNAGQRQGTTPSIEDDIRQFEEDTKLLKALLQATGQNPANFKLPTLDKLQSTTIKPITTTVTPTTTRIATTTITSPQITDLLKLQEDAKLLQALLQATGSNANAANKPSIQGVASRVRIASNPMTTFIGSNPTTQMTKQPDFFTTTPTTTSQTTKAPTSTTTETVVTTDNYRISTTFAPVTQKRRWQTTTSRNVDSTTYLTGRRVSIPRLTVTTELPSTSTFSVQEDIEFLNNLKSVLQTNSNDDPESALANRIIALAVDKSLNEIQSVTKKDTEQLRAQMTTTTTTTTTPVPTTTFRTTTTKEVTPSIEQDIKQFQEDTKLLQALLKATGQDASKFKIPSIPDLTNNKKPSVNTRVQGDPAIKTDLKVLTSLLDAPAFNEPFDSLTTKPTVSTTPRPYGAKISPNSIDSLQNDGKTHKTLISLGGQETTTQRGKLTITGQSPDEALQSLINQKNQKNQKGMMSDATQMPPALSTEFGNSNDALLAALLKEQGFGPTTASSLDEQLKLAALLNQVVVTPKARRTTTPRPPPPPPPPRRPILDGLAWLWQQWRETGARPANSRPDRKPSSSYSTATSNRVNWFGSGPFVGNADDRPANRIPLEPPSAVSPGAQAGRGQLVSAAINVTRAFSQFLGAAIQGAAQTVQNVIKAGQRAASDVYTNGSGGSG